MMIEQINWQYPVVGVILLLVIIWILIQLFGKKKKETGSSGCCGCSLQDSCGKKKTEIRENCDNNNQKNQS